MHRNEITARRGFVAEVVDSDAKHSPRPPSPAGRLLRLPFFFGPGPYLTRSPRRSRATASGLTCALWSLARLHGAGVWRRPPDELLEAVGRMVGEHLGAFTLPQLCEVLEAYSLYRVQGDRQTSSLLAGIGGVLAKGGPSLSASQCAISARAFAKCRVHDEGLLSALAARLREREVRRELGPQEVAHVLYGFAKFTSQDTALLDLLSIEVRRELHRMDVPLVSSTLASLAKAGVSNLVLTSRAAAQLKRTEREGLDAVSPREVIALAMAFGKLQARDEKLFEVFAESLLRRTNPPLEREPCVDLTNIIHAFSKAHPSAGVLDASTTDQQARGVLNSLCRA